MYRMIVRRIVRSAFAALSRGELSMLDQMSVDVHHSFPSDGALGGERHTRADLAAWFHRLHRLLPGLQFQVHAIAVDGWPWDTTIGVEWTDTAVLLDGGPYTNNGAHILRMRWGKIISLHAYVHDVAVIDDALARVAATGVDEATAPPIVTAPTVVGAR
ncbi:MAG: nuclear transport factor 2 family protein [Pseudonocardia sp.]|nr:nuclear transport factor 2 family protein [Pseudonocardia sp.]